MGFNFISNVEFVDLENKRFSRIWRMWAMRRDSMASGYRSGYQFFA
jgi:hypothetical protein